MSEKVLILGASQTKLIKALKNKGYYTIAVSNVVTEKIDALDELVQISTTNFPKIKELISTQNIKRAFTMGSDIAQQTLCKLAEFFGWDNYPSYRLFDQLHQKNQVRQKLIDNNLSSIPLICASTFDNKLFDFSRYEAFVVKPVDGYGSKGISIVHEYNDLEKCFVKAKAFSSAKSVLVEPLIEGAHFTLEFFVHDGSVSILLATAKENNKHLVPYLFKSIKRSPFNNMVKKFATALELENGFYNVDLLQTNDKLELIDIAPRLGGSFLVQMYEQVFGEGIAPKYIDYTISGTEPKQMVPSKIVGLYVLHADKKGELTKLNVPQNYPLLDSEVPDLPKAVESFTESRFQFGYLMYDLPKKLSIESLDENFAEILTVN